MKVLGILGVAAILLGVQTSRAQLKTQVEKDPSVAQEMFGQSSPSFFFGWFNPEKFHMRQSFDMSVQSVGGRGLTLGTYTNSMSYEFSDKLNASADLSLSYSPNNPFSNFGGGKNDLSSLYLSRLQVNYKPWDNTLIQFQYHQLPYGYAMSPFFDPWFQGYGR